MVKYSSTEYDSPNIYSNLNEQQFRLNKISKARDYFISEIKEIELISMQVGRQVGLFRCHTKYVKNYLQFSYTIKKTN